MIKNYEKTKNLIESRGVEDKSAWMRGVTQYALELLESIQENKNEVSALEELKKQALNGADDWSMYSWGGCSLIYNCDICERLAPPSVQKAKKYGELRPNASEEWLDTQARALRQAFARLKNCYSWTLED